MWEGKQAPKAPLSLKYVAIKIMECGSHAHPVILQNSFTHTDTSEEIKGIVHRRWAVVFSLMIALLSSSVELLNSLPTNTHTHNRGDYRAATQDTIIATENRFKSFIRFQWGCRKDILSVIVEALWPIANGVPTKTLKTLLAWNTILEVFNYIQKALLLVVFSKISIIVITAYT